MRDESSHVGKTHSQRESYVKSLKDRSHEPTIDHSMKFPVSDEPEEDFSNPKSKKKRTLGFNEIFANHIKNNWIAWVVFLFISIAGYFTITSNKIKDLFHIVNLMRINKND